MTQHLFILTGASRGMGLAMAEQLIDTGHDLLCISRQHNDALGLRASGAGVRCEQWAQDLSQPEPVALRLELWLNAFDAATVASITLINNAGMLPHIAPLGDIPASELAAALRVDLEAPMLLSSAFLRGTHS